jgi:threonine dehydratase
MSAITRESIARTHHLIQPYVRRTPTIAVNGNEFGMRGTEVVLKLEHCQHSGSFKARGAFANLLMRKVPQAGVVAASGGNHGVAVAYAAKTLGIPAKIFVPRIASPSKIEKINANHADLVVTGERYADALEASLKWAEESGALQVHAYDQEETLLGQGTVGKELEEQDGRVDTVLVAVGGGGLIGGIASWFADRAMGKKTKVIGVEPELAPTLTCALRAGQPVDSPAGGYAADSLAPKRVVGLMFPIAQKNVDRVLLVSDDQIAAAQAALWEHLRIVAEPGGAAAFASLLAGIYVPLSGERVGVVICGGNTTAVDFRSSTPA